MLMLSSSRALGAPRKDTQLDPGTLTQGGILADAEGKLRNAANTFGRISMRNDGIDGRLIAAYQHARAAFIDASQVWQTAHQQTPIAERNNPNEEWQLPPSLGVKNAGFGAASPKATFVPLSQIIVRYGPVGQERTADLADVMRDPYFMYQPQQGLGFPVVLLLCTVMVAVVTVAAVAFILKEGDKAIIARQDAIVAQKLAEAVDATMTQIEHMQLACIGGSADPTVTARCTKQASDAMLAALGLITNAPGFKQPSASSGDGPSGWMIFGGIAVVAVLGVTGVIMYRRLSSNDAPEMAGRRRRRNRRR